MVVGAGSSIEAFRYLVRLETRLALCGEVSACSCRSERRARPWSASIACGSQAGGIPRPVRIFAIGWVSAAHNRSRAPVSLDCLDVAIMGENATVSSVVDLIGGGNGRGPSPID